MPTFSLQKIWHNKAGLAPSGSDNSFTSFPVWADTKHPRLPGEVRPSVEEGQGKENASVGSEMTMLEEKPLRHQRSFRRPMTQKHNHANIPSSTPAPSEANDTIKPRTRALRRTLSKVRSMTDVQWDRPGRGYEQQPSLDTPRSPERAFSPPAPAKHHTGKPSNRLGTFIKRKMSVDSLVSSFRDRTASQSPHVGTPEGASLASPRSFASFEERQSIGSPRSVKFPGSPMSAESYGGLPCLAGIEEECDAERKSVLVGAAEPVGLGLMFGPGAGFREKEYPYRA